MFKKMNSQKPTPYTPSLNKYLLCHFDHVGGEPLDIEPMIMGSRDELLEYLLQFHRHIASDNDEQKCREYYESNFSINGIDKYKVIIRFDCISSQNEYPFNIGWIIYAL